MPVPVEAGEWAMVWSKFFGCLRSLVATLLEIIPIVVVVVLLCLVICVLLCKLFKLQPQSVIVAVVAYASCGLFFGYCVGFGGMQFLDAVLGMVVPILVGVVGMLFKDSRTVLLEYAPVGLGSVSAMVSTMLISMVYAYKIYPH